MVVEPLVQTRPIFGHFRPKLDRIRPTFDQHLPNRGRRRSNVGRLWAEFCLLRPEFGRFGPKLAELDQMWPMLTKAAPNSATFCQVWPESAKIGRSGPNLAPSSTQSGPMSANLGRTWPKLRPHWTKSGPISAKPGRCWPTLDRTRRIPNVDAVLRPTSGGVSPRTRKNSWTGRTLSPRAENGGLSAGPKEALAPRPGAWTPERVRPQCRPGSTTPCSRPGHPSLERARGGGGHFRGTLSERRPGGKRWMMWSPTLCVQFCDRRSVSSFRGCVDSAATDP